MKTRNRAEHVGEHSLAGSKTRFVVFYTLIICIGICTSLGYLMSLVMAEDRLWNAMDTIPHFTEVFGLVHAPALYIGGIWLRLGLPPHGDEGFAVYPYFVVGQWMFMGLLIGIVFAVWTKRNRNKGSLS